MDIISITSKLEEITKRFNLTEEDNGTIELSAKALLFIEIGFLKPLFTDYLKGIERDLTYEEKEFLKEFEKTRKFKKIP